ncbi:MAG: membrane-bound lytic murein transglycosylase MltF [Xanthomonadales bacterium]|nr:membrane-bound lytic murein transglycosylase MltF [Xanthomonadales bacterium]NNL95700.1 membrane-bound lytic murein transglycosylase MltF [Xanthomonadales bacterium]
MVLLLPFLTSGNDAPTRVEQVERRGSLTMLTRNGASSYFLGADGDTGPEYELVSAFASFIGVDVEVRVADAFSQLAGLLQDGQGDLIAANLTRTPSRESQFRFGPDYDQAHTEVVYRRGTQRPESIEDLVGLNVAVIAGTSYEEILQRASTEVPALEYEALEDVGMEDLLLAVSEGHIDATLVDSNILKINRHFYPSLRRGFTLEQTQPQAWAFVSDDDDSLVQQARMFMTGARETGLLTSIQDQFFNRRNNLDQVGMFHFLKQVRNRLPQLLPVFQDVAAHHDLDWRLLAAMGYQESHWDPDARSHTGVRGIMMLTQRTARQLGLNDRLDPVQSIEGGARYLLRLWGRIPDRIPDPDRTWMALAAYNMGWGHLEDVRVLTQKQGGDPDRWQDVSERLPLLTQEKWYKQTRYGYARGLEAQRYVRNIRNYYDILVWMDTRAHPLLVVDNNQRSVEPPAP